MSPPFNAQHTGADHVNGQLTKIHDYRPAKVVYMSKSNIAVLDRSWNIWWVCLGVCVTAAASAAAAAVGSGFRPLSIEAAYTYNVRRLTDERAHSIGCTQPPPAIWRELAASLLTLDGISKCIPDEQQVMRCCVVRVHSYWAAVISRAWILSWWRRVCDWVSVIL